MDTASDTALQKILNYLKEAVYVKNSDKLQLLEKIFERDQNLLKRLSE